MKEFQIMNGLSFVCSKREFVRWSQGMSGFGPD